jgi:hypothetical protein
MSLWWRVRRSYGDQPIASPDDPTEWIIVDPVNIEQLVCICGQEVFDSPSGFVHRDGSDTEDRGELIEVTA